ncbi:DUF4837 family protein [Fodinibius halophilus]|uniref:DUF4837 family protein n=1 Tax=Fodinibius halophilus TaxID=1736908 RepID=A0A6M1SZB8_9BACT|nr:DUF4837 family protein [Fodinibius halophilus]NGP86979.1 DUF4837 family protein [Fodinibius halophilus]
MKEIGKVASILLLTVIWIGCEGDYRQKASGSFGQVIVVMDSADFESNTAEALRQTFGGWTQTIPGKPPRFDLSFRDFDSNEQLDRLKKFRNIIIAAPIDDSTNVSEFMRALLSDDVERKVRDGEAFAFPLKDQWYRDQWLLLLSAPSDTALATQIKNSQKTLVDNLIDKELNRWTAEIYERGEQFALEDSLWQNHGWKIRVQHDWIKSIDTTYTDNGDQANFLTMRRPLPNNDRWFWAWWKKVDNINHVDDSWINTKRDSLNKKWFEGSSNRRDSYVTTAYKRPHETETFRMNGNFVYETRGVWRMTEDAMAGPFVNFTVYDKETSRLFMLEFAQFAPKYDKRKFVRQFRAMLRTFESDSTWQANSQKSMATN